MKRLQLNKRLNIVDEEGILPLTLALSTGQESIAKTLVSHRADVNAVDARGRSLLYRAIEDCIAFFYSFTNLFYNGALNMETLISPCFNIRPFIS